LDSGGIDRFIVARDVLMVVTGANLRFMHPHIRESLGFNSHKYLEEANKAISEICVICYEAFDTVDNASKIGSLDLEEMVKRYDNGKLDPRVV
jgi:fructose-bisphosphate aldolase class II